MSMLTAQIANLRLMARLVREYDYSEISRMLREAADTIESLRERAQAATLGSEECDWMLRDKWPNDTGDDYVYGYETSCGARHTWWPDSLPKFCPTCGGKVKAVKR